MDKKTIKDLEFRQRPNLMCVLHYTVVVWDNTRGLIGCICNLTDCKTPEGALEYYYKHYHNENRKIEWVEASGYIKEELDNLSLAA